jgi:glycosyltransferase involved in cell wall biosynthesis
VALDRGAVSEVVEHERTGFVCRDVAEMASMIHRTDRIDPADCRQRAADVFDVEVMVRAYERAYRDVVQGRAKDAS